MNDIDITAGGELVERVASHSVADTAQRIAAAAQTLGMTVFATIDHAAGAREADLDLPDEVVVLVGSPRVGTGIMQSAPRAGLDLPLRVLVWDDAGTTKVTYRDPRGLRRDHDLAGLEATLERMGAGLAKLVEAAS